MIATDGRQVAIAGIDDNVQLGVCQLQSSSEWDGAAVRGMERIQLDVARHAARASDARDQSQRFQIDFRFDERARERVDSSTDAASRTPDVRHTIAAQEGLDRVHCWITKIVITKLVITKIGDQAVRHRLASAITSRMSLGS